MSTSTFEQLAQDYDNWFDEHPHIYQAELDAIRLLFPDNASGLEVGVGTGRFAVPLGIKIGVEPSPAMRQIAAKHDLRIVDSTAETLPFPDNHFDFVLFVTLDCFLASLEQAYTEAYRVIRQGGFILVAMLNKDSSLVQEYEKRKHNSRFYRDATFHSVEEISRVLEKIGFQDFHYAETLFQKLSDIQIEEPVKTGYSHGGFVVIRARK